MPSCIFFNCLRRNNNIGDYPIILEGILINKGHNIRLLLWFVPAVLELKDISKVSGLVDNWRLQDPSSRDYTFFSLTFNILKDLFQNQATLVIYLSMIKAHYSSTYCPLIGWLDQAGSTRWRLNSRILLCHLGSHLGFKSIEMNPLNPKPFLSVFCTCNIFTHCRLIFALHIYKNSIIARLG